MTDKELIEIEIAYFQEQIKVKQKKLKELEQTKSPVKEAYKDWWGDYPELETDSQYDDTRWVGFQAGYEFAWAIAHAKKVVEKVQEEQKEENEWKSVALRFGEKLSGYLSDGYYELSPAAWFRWAVFTYGKGQQIKETVRESVRWCEENPDKDPLDWLKPQTPEQVADGLKEAFREAVKQGIIPEIKQPTDELIEKLVKKPPEFLKFELGKTLEDVVHKWWQCIFSTNSDWDCETCIDDLIDQVELFLPREQDASGSQNTYAVAAVEGFNDAIKKIKSKLRNKKV